MSKRARVLVVDDDPLFRSLIVSLLRKDYLVSVSSDGSEGFYKALEHPPDIAIIDIRMPGWDGLKTLRAFRSHPSLNRVKAVMLTSDASKESVLAAIHGGANDYIIKTSFSKAEFYQKLEKLVPAQAIQRRDGVLSHQLVDSAAPPEPKHLAGAPQKQSAFVAASAPKSAAASAEKQLAARTATAPAAQEKKVLNELFDEAAALQEIIDGWE